jgi:hypothetical protein
MRIDAADAGGHETAGHLPQRLGSADEQRQVGWQVIGEAAEHGGCMLRRQVDQDVAAEDQMAAPHLVRRRVEQIVL